MVKKKYGVIYTPNRLANFVAELLFHEMNAENYQAVTILDPACGECALLQASRHFFDGGIEYIGIDIDKDAVNAIGDVFPIINNDAILPQNVKRKTADYWKSKLPPVTAVIANPPWSSEKIYDKFQLTNAGFEFIDGQYDSYVLFVELAISILEEGGYFAFILPDSIFDAQNERLRRYLSANTQVKVITRLGEKIFDEVNRATTVIVCRKLKPMMESQTKCFRLSTNARRDFLSSEKPLMDYFNAGSHYVLQHRFLANESCIFDVDTRADEEVLLTKIKKKSINWSEVFVFGRGVEISKAGKVVFCSSCGCAQGYKKEQLRIGKKTCTKCGAEMAVTVETVHRVIDKKGNEGSVQILVGENVRRYAIDGVCYIMPNISGINYKDVSMYSPPKLLIRKTGLGIYGAVDYTGNYTSQTVYILKLRTLTSKIPLEYYLAMINSRVVYYYYLKVYGENEWKSHPYLTKQIVFSLPIRMFEGSELDNEIIALSKRLSLEYDYESDIKLEYLIMEKYELSQSEIKLVVSEMNQLPNLSAINNMKMEAN